MIFLEFLDTTLQDPANSWISWENFWQDSYPEIQDYPRMLSRVPRVFTLGKQFKLRNGQTTMNELFGPFLLIPHRFNFPQFRAVK